MKISKSLLTICLIGILLISVGVMIQKQKNALSTLSTIQESTITDKAHILAMPIFSRSIFESPDDLLILPIVVPSYSGVSEKATLLENTSRTEILRYIQANPGVQFRAICSSLGLSIGVVQFHLAVLQKNGLIKSICIGKYKRFFAAGKFSRKEMQTISTLKLETVKNILKTLLERKKVAHHELAIKLCISSQGLTWQMNRLQETGLIREDRKGLNVSYSLNASSIVSIIQAMSFVENTAD